MLAYEDAPRLDGIITHLLAPEYYASFHQQGTHIVNFSSRFDLAAIPPFVHHVLSDDEAIGRAAARHFSSMGLNHFAYFGNDELFYSRSRERGFFAFLQGVGQDALEEPVAQATYHRWGDGVQADRDMGLWLNSLPKPIGLFCAQDHYARTLVRNIRKLGISIPGDVAVIGVDADPILSELSEVRLTSVIPNGAEVGARAVDVLVRALREKKGQDPEYHRIPPLGLHYDQSAPRYHAGDRDLARALQWLEKHFRENISVEEMARAVGMSRRAIEYRFREKISSSPYQKLLQMRLQHACELLRGSNQTITEIAEECGFSNQRELCVRFKQKQGVTPTEYRLQAVR